MPILKYVICFLNDAITKNIRIIVDICKETVTPLRNDHILRLKKRRKAELRLRRTFIELLLYMVFLAMLYLVSFGNRDPRWFYAKQHFDQQLITVTNISKGTANIKFNQVIIFSITS